MGCDEGAAIPIGFILGGDQDGDDDDLETVAPIIFSTNRCRMMIVFVEFTQDETLIGLYKKHKSSSVGTVPHRTKNTTLVLSLHQTPIPSNCRQETRNPCSYQHLLLLSSNPNPISLRFGAVTSEHQKIVLCCNKMEDQGGAWFDGLSNDVRRKRSRTSGRPRTDPLPAFEGCGLYPLSSTLSFEDASQASSPKNASGDANFDLKLGISHSSQNVGMNDGRNSEGPRQSGVSQDGMGNETKVKKLTLKFGGATYTIHANPTCNMASESGLTAKSSHSLDSRRHKKQKSNSDDNPRTEQGHNFAPVGYLEEMTTSKVSALMDNNCETTLPTHQQAIRSSKDAFASGASFIEFPNRLPSAPPSSNSKGKLSEMEQQLRRAEAARKRKMQHEEAAKETQAKAIRKILGQGSGRKKKEEKMKKRQEELALEKAANANMLPPNTIRTTMGPNGTTMTFPKEMGFPSIFNQPPVSYPPPREKCANPSCTNTSKSRHSKLKLPICCLQCYKAVEKVAADETSV
ncbi:hypothetical protein RIF29_24811 [Crotalaria pallida]|uniref:INO80 complex subunit B-like conserved region domain-containing protein n=1 Tax=Crotalaria pallida TaxID=3830 RepID=A0AAN9I3L4_CROPI